MDIGNDFTAIFLDISKYFDKIWHVGLLHKCKILFGITGSLHNWFESYLTDRSIKVCVENSTSRPLLINAGCPQGSVLGPLLALIYLNDLAGKTHNDSLFYADDTSLYTSYSRQSSCTSPPQQPTHQQDFNTACKSLQDDLDIISEFGTKWHINFSADKTKQMTFTNATTSHSPVMSFIKRPVPSTKSHTHLGLTLSTDLRFHDHINNVIKKVNIALSPLYPIAKFLPRDILLQLYNTYILPIFDYGDIVHDGLITTRDKLRLEQLQMRAARLVTGTLFHTAHKKLLAELGWETLEMRRFKHRLIFYHKLLNPSADIPQYIKDILPHTRHENTGLALRNADTVSLPNNKTTLFQKAFIPKTTRDWNSLPATIRTEPCLKSFKRAIFSLYGTEPAPKFNSVGCKVGNILHTRLRLNASTLNAHLFQIQKASSPCCDCGSPKETVAHLVLNCPHFNMLRSELFRQISCITTKFQQANNSKKLDMLLIGTDLSLKDGFQMAILFQNFLIKTKRFHLNAPSGGRRTGRCVAPPGGGRPWVTRWGEWRVWCAAAAVCHEDVLLHYINYVTFMLSISHHLCREVL